MEGGSINKAGIILITMKLLVAPAHYILSKTEGSEYTRAYEYIETVSKQGNISGDVLVCYSPFKKIGKFNVISYQKEKPAYISIVLRLKFIFWVLLTSLRLMKKNTYDCIWHIGPFAIGETFSLLALFNRKKLRFILGPIYTPFPYLGTSDFGLYGNKDLGNISIFLKAKNKLEREIYLRMSKVFSSLSYLTLKNVNTVVAIEEPGRKLLTKMGIKHVKVLPLGVNETDYIFKKKPIQHNKIQLLSIGYLVSRKRFADIIDAIYILVSKKNIKNIHLTIVGIGNEQERLEEMVKNYKLDSYISFVGFVPRTQLSDCYKKADVFVFGSTIESMPGVYFEAMASSMPMVLAENPTSLDLKNQGMGGFVVEGENPKKFADAVERLIKSKKNMYEMGQKNLKLFQDKYDFNQNIKKLVQEFQK